MTLKIIQKNGIQIISCLTGVVGATVAGAGADAVAAGATDVLQFNCHDNIQEVSYGEQLTLEQFVARIRQLNKRVHFPTKAVRAALSSGNPVDASLTNTMEEQETQPTVLSLKYRIDGAPAPLKWEWHLKATDSAIFYRCVLKDALHAATYLDENIHTLLDILKKKDIELKQYRIEGAQLRRTTVATEPFDVDAFQEQHKEMLDEVATYGEVGQVLVDSSKTPSPVIKIETVDGTTKSADVVTTIPCSSAVTTKAISPRNRKRKAMETGIQHVERKVLQRRRVPVLQYKDSQSQEDNLGVSLLEDNSTVKIEEAEQFKEEIKGVESIDMFNTTEPVKIEEAEQLEHEIKGEESTNTTEPDTSLNAEDSKNELDAIMEMINLTAKQTHKMLKEHNIK